MEKTAIITGITGMDGSHLADLLLGKDYRVVGLARRGSTSTDERILHLYANPAFRVVQGDVTDPLCLYRLLENFPPNEFYNLAAQSFVKASFEEPAHTSDVTYKGALNCLEAVRTYQAAYPDRPKVRFYQASSSEMFGSSFSLRYKELNRINGTDPRYQDEATPFLPNSPYAVAKLAAHHLVRVYRDSYGLFACSGILFNHEGPRRGECFVTRKITKYVARLAEARALGRFCEPLRLGNMEARRDWGHAEDMVRGMHMMLQHDTADDYVLATGESHSVAEFLDAALEVIGVPRGQAAAHYEVDSELYRPSEVPFLRGDASKAKRVLGWEPTISFGELVERMVRADISPLDPVRVSER